MRETISLDGKWDLTYFPEGNISTESIVKSNGEVLTWLEAKVPGNCQLDLIRQGELPDPFFGLNSRKFREQENYEWWYRRELTLKEEWSGRKLELLFEGIDTFATIWLNRALIGKVKNMFIPHSFDITERVNFEEPNILLIRIHSVVNSVKRKELDGTYDALNYRERLWVRKAAHSFGWDIAPRIVTTGLWRSVSILAHKKPEIVDYFFEVSYACTEYASMAISVALDLPQRNLGELILEVCGRCGDSRFGFRSRVMTLLLKRNITVDNPKLWWPKDVGDPNLYDVSIRLIKDKVLLDERQLRIGIRTIKLLQESQPDNGTSFIFVINGEKIFIKGSNWVPVDAFHGRDNERIPEILEIFSDLNCNMIRVWGGGVYESELFYEFCDKEGIMVWQDFMYACGIYPQVQELMDLARHEAEVIVRRLRNHPCIVLWCGDNEVDEMYVRLGRDPSENKISRMILKDVCCRLDKTRPYWPSSPHTPSRPKKPNYKLDGDTHIWHHGTYFKVPEYSEDKSRFITEIGHLSAPDAESIRRFISEKKVWRRDDEELNHHFGTLVELKYSPKRRSKMEESIQKFFGEVPEDLYNYVLASQIVQAEALKFFIERARQRKFECGGILWWNIIDCWPQFSDSVVDYYFCKKLAFEYIKRVQYPYLICMGEPVSRELSVYIINDTLDDVKAEFEVKAFSLKDKVLYNRVGYAIILRNSKKIVEAVKVHEISSKLAPPYLFVLRLLINNKVMENHYFYGSIPFQLEDYKRFLKKFSSLKSVVKFLQLS